MKKPGRITAFTLLILWMAFIFVMSARPAAQSSSDSGKVIDNIGPVIEENYNSFTPQQKYDFIEALQYPIRLLAHFIEYNVLGVLAFCTALTFPIKNRKRIGHSLLFCILYSVTDELHQIFVPGRTAQLSDIITDSLGALLGILFVALTVFTVNKLKEVIRLGKARN